MTKAERRHLDRVAGLGCIVCRIHKSIYTPAGIHHIRAGVGMGQRSPHTRVIGLCSAHHQTGGHEVAIHAGRATWEANYGTELELLEAVEALLK